MRSLCSLQKIRSWLGTYHSMSRLSGNFFSRLALATAFIFTVFAGQNARASLDFVNSSNVTVTSNIEQGYIELKIPIYDSGGEEEGLPPGSYFTINGVTCMTFYSMNGFDDWQEETGWYWIKATKGSGAVKVIAIGVREGGNQDVGSTTICNFNEDLSNNHTFAVFQIYVSESLLGKDLSYTVHMDPDENGDGDGAGDNAFNVTGTIHKVSYASPTLTYNLSATPGKYDVHFTMGSAASDSKYNWNSSSRVDCDHRQFGHHPF